MREKKLNITKRIGKPRIGFIYGVILFIATIALVWTVMYNLWWVPRMSTGTPMLGYRMEGIPELDESWITATEEFGGNQKHIDEVEIHSTTGPVIYFNVRIIEGTSLKKARAAATEIVEHFIDISDEVALHYNLQIVISHGDIEAIKVENQAAVTAHAHEHLYAFAESTLDYAEQYPSSGNVQRAEVNINTRLTNSIRFAVGEEGLEQMKERLAAITVMTSAEESALIEELGYMPSYSTIMQVPATEISQFPNWGTWNDRRSRIDWN